MKMGIVFNAQAVPATVSFLAIENKPGDLPSVIYKLSAFGKKSGKL